MSFVRHLAVHTWKIVIVGALIGCSEKQPAPGPAQENPESGQEVERAPEPDPDANAAQPLDIPPTMPAPSANESVPLRHGAPSVFAQYTAGTVVPMAILESNKWIPQDVQSLDKLPEGARGKDARLDVVSNWWKHMDINDGDVFLLRGDRGARGSLTVRRQFATADRGGCVGLVWAIPGEASWEVEPRGQTHWGASERNTENIWAFRGRWRPRTAVLDRQLTEKEMAAAKIALRRIRYSIRRGLPVPESGASWNECDSLNDPRCQNYRAQAFPLDLEGDGRAEIVATVQFRPSSQGTGRTRESTIESRVLIGVTDSSGYLLGKWDGDSSKVGEEARAPRFVGAIDITGDGRAEMVFKRVSGEAENWYVYQVSPERVGQWHVLFRTQIEGC